MVHGLQVYVGGCEVCFDGGFGYFECVEQQCCGHAGAVAAAGAMVHNGAGVFEGQQFLEEGFVACAEVLRVAVHVGEEGVAA